MMNYAIDSVLTLKFCSSKYSPPSKRPTQKISANCQDSGLSFLAESLGSPRNSSRHLKHPQPLIVRSLTLACQEPPHFPHTHHAFLPLPQVTPVARQLFLRSSHSATRSGRLSARLAYLPFLFPFLAHSGQLVRPVLREFGEDSQICPHDAIEHLHLCFLLLPIATPAGDGLSSCHSAAKRLLAATDLQLQNEVLLSQAGQTMSPPNLVRSLALASHSCTSPQSGQPRHCRQTLLWLPCV